MDPRSAADGALVPRNGGFGSFGRGNEVVRARNPGEARNANKATRNFLEVKRAETQRTRVAIKVHNSQKHLYVLSSLIALIRKPRPTFTVNAFGGFRGVPRVIQERRQACRKSQQVVAPRLAVQIVAQLLARDDARPRLRDGHDEQLGDVDVWRPRRNPSDLLGDVVARQRLNALRGQASSDAASAPCRPRRPSPCRRGSE